MNKKYIRLDDGNILFESINDIKNIKTANNIIDLLEQGDFVRIEFLSLRETKKITRLFEVEYVAPDRMYISLYNAHMNFTIYNGNFVEDEFTPVIKSLITNEKIKNIEYKLHNENDLNNTYNNAKYLTETSNQLVKKPKNNNKGHNS